MKNSKQRIEVVTILVGSASEMSALTSSIENMTRTLIEEEQNEEDIERSEEHRAIERDLGDQPWDQKRGQSRATDLLHDQIHVQIDGNGGAQQLGQVGEDDADFG